MEEEKQEEVKCAPPTTNLQVSWGRKRKKYYWAPQVENHNQNQFTKWDIRNQERNEWTEYAKREKDLCFSSPSR